MLEPYMPSFSAKIYEQMKLERTERQEKLLSFIGGSSTELRDLVPGGHKIGKVAPVFRQITNLEVDEFRQQYGSGQDK